MKVRKKSSNGNHDSTRQCTRGLDETSFLVEQHLNWATTEDSLNMVYQSHCLLKGYMLFIKNTEKLNNSPESPTLSPFLSKDVPYLLSDTVYMCVHVHG